MNVIAGDRSLTIADMVALADPEPTLAISDDAWAEVCRHVTDPAHQVEFVVALGNWTLFSILLRNLAEALARRAAGRRRHLQVPLGSLRQ